MSEAKDIAVVEDSRLKDLVEKSELESTKAAILLQRFGDYFKVAAEWEIKAKAITVTDASQTSDMAMARIGRLELRQKRIAIEHTRKELKEQSLREGKAIDGIANVLKGVIVPIEEYLDKQEKFVERKEAAEAATAKAEEEAQAERDRIAQEEAERKEQERIRLENERLKKEAEAKEKALAKERAKVEAEKEAAEKKAREEREAAEKARLEAERKASEEKEQIETAARVEREKIQAEKEAIERKAQQDKEAAEKKVQAERKKARELKIEQERIEAERKAAEIECPYCHERFIPKEI